MVVRIVLLLLERFLWNYSMRGDEQAFVDSIVFIHLGLKLDAVPSQIAELFPD